MYKMRVSELTITTQEWDLGWWYIKNTSSVLSSSQKHHILRIITKGVEDTGKNFIIIVLYKWIKLECSVQFFFWHLRKYNGFKKGAKTARGMIRCLRQLLPKEYSPKMFGRRRGLWHWLQSVMVQNHEKGSYMKWQEAQREWPGNTSSAFSSGKKLGTSDESICHKFETNERKGLLKHVGHLCDSLLQDARGLHKFKKNPGEIYQ